MFERLRELYERKGCTKEQLQRYVALGKITQVECDSILEEVSDAEYRQN